MGGRAVQAREGSVKPAIPTLPDVARSILKGAIMGLVNSGLITGADADRLIALLGLTDA